MASEHVDARVVSDRLAAQDVIVQYAACIDDRDFEQYRECFAPAVERSWSTGRRQ